MFAMAWLGAAVAFGHGGVQRTVEVDDARTAVTVEAPAELVWDVLGIRPHEVERHRGAIGTWMMDGLRFTTNAPCDVSDPVLSVTDVIRADARLSCSSGPLTVRDDTLAQALPGERTVVTGGAVLTAGAVEATLDGRSPLHTLATYVWQGVLHLVGGYDHVLFLLCLIVGAGLWSRRDGAWATLGQLAGIVTAFTVGHSLTLVAAAMGWVVAPGWLVETVIAGSIALVALQNVVWPDMNVGHRPWVALGFGLVHGLGFASVLAELGLPAGERVLALLSFNVGIEAGQLAAVALALGPLWWLARHPDAYRRWVVIGGSALAGAVALVWTAQRVVGAPAAVEAPGSPRHTSRAPRRPSSPPSSRRCRTCRRIRQDGAAWRPGSGRTSGPPGAGLCPVRHRCGRGGAAPGSEPARRTTRTDPPRSSTTTSSWLRWRRPRLPSSAIPTTPRS